MRAQDLARLVALAALWGGSYLFMRHAVPHMGAVLLVEVRVLLGGAALAAFVYATGGTVGWRAHWPNFLFMGAMGIALPFVLIAQALTVIDASTAAILNALSPLFASLVAAWWIRDPLTPRKLAGIALCLAGTGVLVGWTPRPATGEELVAAGMSVLATVLYGYCIVFAKVKLREARPVGTAVGTLLFAAAVMLPFTPVTRDVSAVPPDAWLAAGALALLSTAVAYLLFYRLIADVGPVKTITVTLLVPVFGMVWGVAFLGEPVTPGRIAGCAIILAGCALILGLVRMPARAPSRAG